MENILPFVSVLMPVRNEEKYIENTIKSVLENDYPKDNLEILIIDGESTDRTRELVNQIAQNQPIIRLLHNPDKIQAIALNIGMNQAKGDIIIRMDAHTIYAQDYIRNCVDLLLHSGADNVGGVQFAVGNDYITRGIAIATMTPFGAGNAYFRYSDKERWVDTVYLGAWKKSILLKLGGYNPHLKIVEDCELNYRLRKSGGKILLSPKIKCHYFVRSSLFKLMKQYYKYGFYKSTVLRHNPDSIKSRQIIPPVFCLALFISIILLFLKPVYGIIIPAIYLIFNLLFSMQSGLKHGPLYIPILPVIFFIIHISWGSGFWCGLIKNLFNRT